MGLSELGGMGVGSNARKREKCQVCQCLIRVGGNWNEIGNHWKVDGKKLEKIGEVARTIGVGGNARSRGKCQADNADDVRYMVFVLKT